MRLDGRLDYISLKVFHGKKKNTKSSEIRNQRRNAMERNLPISSFVIPMQLLGVAIKEVICVI